MEGVCVFVSASLAALASLTDATNGDMTCDSGHCRPLASLRWPWRLATQASRQVRPLTHSVR